MTSLFLRNKWISFFESKGHFDVSNKSLIPHSSDKSLLFINSGVAAIKSYFYGDSNCPNPRLVSCQKVIRTGDIDNITSSYRHHTYFEMLGNFSIGDYFKKEAIEWAWRFLTEEINLPPDRFYVTVYEHDKEAYFEWEKWISKERIILGSKNTNFWDLGVGPCGPCTEIYYDRGIEFDPENIGLDLLRKNIDNERYLEVWNIVFSEFLNVDGEIVPGSKKNIDTGAGLERLVSILENKTSNFETSLFVPIIDLFTSEFGGISSDYYAVSDYFRTSCLLINEGILFGNKGREFVLRKIFRKAISLLKFPKLNKNFFSRLVEVISSTLPYYRWKTDFICDRFYEEYRLFINSYNISSEFLVDIMEKYSDEIPVEEIFKLVTQQGGDYAYISEKLLENNRFFSEEKYKELMEIHKNKSINTSISSAFVKKHPSLINLEVDSEIDYSSKEIAAPIVAIFDDKFNRVNQITEEGYLILKKTVVFPLSGGQDSDDGFINEMPILSSIKAPNGQVLHKVNGNFKETDIVNIKHDPEKRKYLEIHHTLEHIFYELLKKEVSPEISRYSGNKYRDYFSIEISTPPDVNKCSFDLLKLDEKLQEIIQQNFPVNISFISLDEYRSLNLPQKFEEVYEKSRNKLRLVNIGGYSQELCVGTHVKNTKQIENFLITSFKKKQSNIYKFKLVGSNELVSNLLQKHNCSREKFLSSLLIDAKSQKTIHSKQQIESLILELMDFEGNLNIIHKKVDPNLALVVFRSLISRIKDKTIFLFFRDDGGYRFFMASDTIDVKKFIDNLKVELKFKGGGNKNFGSGFGAHEDFESYITPLLLEDSN